jgi:cell division protease FtsH
MPADRPAAARGPDSQGDDHSARHGAPLTQRSGREKHNYSRDYLNDQIAILPGGRIAEEIRWTVSRPARATISSAPLNCASHGVRVGHEHAMGPLTFGKGRADPSREIPAAGTGEDTALKIDHEVKRFVRLWRCTRS